MTKETNAETRRSTTDRVKDRVGDAKESVQDTASHLAAEARERTGHIAEEGREKAHEISDKAQQIARSRADEQKQRVTNGIRTFADALRHGCDDLSPDQNQYRPLLNSAADRVEGVSRYLEGRDVDALTGDVRRFAREHTPLFLTGAFALGFAGARFLKSSGEQDERERDSLQYRSGQDRERFDRMLPETGTMGDRLAQPRTSEPGRTATPVAETLSTEERTGTGAFEDGGLTGGRTP